MTPGRKSDEPRRFLAKWGFDVANHYYTQVPNLLIRNLGRLNISTSEYGVLLIILSHTSERYIATSEFSRNLNLSKSTIKNNYRSLEKKGYIKRIRTKGQANFFDYSGLKNALKLIVSESNPVQNLTTPIPSRSVINRTYEQNLDTTQSITEHPHGQGADTNKEHEDIDNTKSGIEQFKTERKNRGI